jgi:hypothetical protein
VCRPAQQADGHIICHYLKRDHGRRFTLCWITFQRVLDDAYHDADGSPAWTVRESWTDAAGMFSIHDLSAEN